MEKELRSIKNRGYFPVPQLAPGECKIETIQDKEVLIKEIDEIAVEMLNAIKESEENYKREQEQARIRDEQLRSARQTSRSDTNLYPTLANSTPIRNRQHKIRSTRSTLQHKPSSPHLRNYMSDRGNQYKPLKNDSILQGATSSPVDQFATNAADMRQVVTNHGDKTMPQTQAQTQSIADQQPGQPDRNGLQNDNSPNPSRPQKWPNMLQMRRTRPHENRMQRKSIL